VAQALGILRGDQWVDQIGEGLTELKVRVKQPAVEHRVRMKDFRRWLDSQGRTPAERTRKRKLMALAKGTAREEDSNIRPTAVSHMVSLVVVKVLAALTHRRNFDYLPAVIVTNPQVSAGRRQRFWNPGNLHGAPFFSAHCR
jgi:hypothetical protein